MFHLKPLYIGLTVGCLVPPFATLDAASAGPIGVVGTSVLSPSSAITSVRYRWPIHHRRGVGPAAVIGMFGAIRGGVAANQRYENYSYDAYGQPYDYGYAPGYFSGPAYHGGGGRANFGGRGGGGRANGGWSHADGAAHAGGSAHMGKN